MPGLGVLKVTNCGVGDESLEALLPLVPADLKHLLVDYNPLSAAGLRRLADFCEGRPGMALSAKSPLKPGGRELDSGC